MNKDFKWKNLKKGFFALAPMAGITDSPFRRVCKSFGADVVFTEFVHVRGVASKNKRTLDLLNYKESERPIIAQIFGKEPEFFSKAAKIIQDLGFDGIDINMGCPARKVKEHGSGSALLKDKNLAREIVLAVKESATIPVSVKTRLGIEKYEGPEFVCMLADSGAELVTVHGRTVNQKFGGSADYESIKDIINSVDIPIIGNGDVSDYNSYKQLIDIGCFGVMIGRASYGNPWIFDSIKENQSFSPSKLEWKRVVLNHAKFIDDSREKNFLPFRKHLAWYVKGFENARLFREKLVQVNDYSDIIEIVEQI